MDDYCPIKGDKCIHCTEEDGETYCGETTGETRVRLMKECPRDKRKRKK